jgi:hypothetical protein
MGNPSIAVQVLGSALGNGAVRYCSARKNDVAACLPSGVLYPAAHAALLTPLSRPAAPPAAQIISVAAAATLVALIAAVFYTQFVMAEKPGNAELVRLSKLVQ